MIEVEHVPKRTETVTELVGDPDSVDGEIKNVTEKTVGGQTAYEVTHDLVVTEEQYLVHTRDAREKEARTYFVEETDAGEWKIAKVRKNPNRGHPTVAGSNVHDQLSTPAVREALAEHDIEIVN